MDLPILQSQQVNIVPGLVNFQDSFERLQTLFAKEVFQGEIK